MRLFGAAQTLSRAPGGNDEPPEQDLAAALLEARSALGPQAAQRAWLLGQAMPPTAVRSLVASVLDDVLQEAVTSRG